MARFIVLSQENRDYVDGPTLDPIQRVANAATPNPVYILNILVLSDAAHEEFWEYLGALPQMDVGDPNFPSAIEPPEQE
jgi:hypothetical protein